MSLVDCHGVKNKSKFKVWWSNNFVFTSMALANKVVVVVKLYVLNLGKWLPFGNMP